MKSQIPNPKFQISSKLQAPTWSRGVGGVAVVWAFGLNAKAQRRKDAEKTGWGEGRGACAPQFLPLLCVSAPLRLCVKLFPTNSECRFPNRHGVERSAGFSTLHRADDGGFRKNSCAGKIRGAKGNWFVSCVSVLLLAFAGCQVAPSPTTKTVTTNNVLGVWSLVEDYGQTTIFITFAASGIFTQQTVTPAGTNNQVGKWSLNGPHLNLTDFLAKAAGGWTNTSINWYFVDGEKRLEIFGGAFPDPDAFQHLKHLRSTP